MAADSEGERILARLHSLADPYNVEGMARFGIRPARPLGISVRNLRALARECGKNHALAERLWESGIHEARILASLLADPSRMSGADLERWVSDLDSWDLCDQCCLNLFDKTAGAYQKAAEWSHREEQYVKRAGFSLMAVLAVHDRDAPDATFEAFFPRIVEGARDDRNYVKKAVSWALRQIGKRNPALLRAALACAESLQTASAPSARWVGTEAVRELRLRLHPADQPFPRD